MKRKALAVAVALLAASAFAQDKPDALKTYRLGRDLEAQGRASEANDRYNAAVKICGDELAQNPQNMDAYTVLTWSLLRQKKYKEVVDWGLKGLKVNGSELRVMETVGEAYFFNDDLKESMRYFQAYVDGAPQGERASVAYFFMGEIFRIQKRFNHADIAYTTACLLTPDMALWWYRLGSVREAAGDFAPSAQAYQKALALNPQHKDALDGLDRVKRHL